MSMSFPQPAPAVTADEALRMIGQDAVLIDVREQVEWDAGHAPQATHAPMSQLGQIAASLPIDETMIVICRSGRRSDDVTNALNNAGFRALNLAGGMQAWQLAGGAVVRDDGSPGTVI